MQIVGDQICEKKGTKFEKLILRGPIEQSQFYFM